MKLVILIALLAILLQSCKDNTVPVPHAHKNTIINNHKIPILLYGVPYIEIGVNQRTFYNVGQSVYTSYFETSIIHSVNTNDFDMGEYSIMIFSDTSKRFNKILGYGVYSGSAQNTFPFFTSQHNINYTDKHFEAALLGVIPSNEPLNLFRGFYNGSYSLWRLVNGVVNKITYPCIGYIDMAGKFNFYLSNDNNGYNVNGHINNDGMSQIMLNHYYALPKLCENTISTNVNLTGNSLNIVYAIPTVDSDSLYQVSFNLTRKQP